MTVIPVCARLCVSAQMSTKLDAAEKEVALLEMRVGKGEFNPMTTKVGGGVSWWVGAGGVSGRECD